MENQVDLARLTPEQALRVQAQMLGYKRMPATIEEFVNSEYYLGRMFGNGKLYGYWMDILKKIYPTPIHVAYPYVIFTGPIGTGKSTVSKIMALYLLHKLDCLANFDYFGVVISKTIDWIFCHTSSGKAYTDLIESCWKIYGESPYFTSDFQWDGSLYKFAADGPRSNNSIGGDVLFYQFSEVNFIDYWKAKYKIDQAFSRFKSRFIRVIGYFGNIIIDSSAAGDNSIVEYLIKEYPYGMLVCKDPIWKVKESLGIYFRKGSFKVYTGDNTCRPFIIDDEHPITSDHDPDRILEVPKELEPDYQSDIELALQNTAGVSTGNSDLFFAEQDKLKASFTIPQKIPDVIVSDFYDDEQYYDQIREQLLKIPKEKIIYISIDMGVSNDLAGFSISYFDDWIYKEGKATIEFKTKTPVSFGISRKPGQETAIVKIYNLIMRISEDFEIGAVTTDQYQSTQLRQDLSRAGIYTYLYSVDRTKDAYVFYKTQVYKGYQETVNNSLLLTEQKALYDDGYKVDHPYDGCFTGDSEVLVLDGPFLAKIPFKELIHKYKICKVLTYNTYNYKFEWADINSVWISKKVTELIELTFTDGLTIRCTPDHRFLTTKGYLEARYLRYGTKLISNGDSHFIINRRYIKVEPTEVYDLEAAKNSNFALANGAIVHNSKDISDSVVASVKAIKDNIKWATEISSKYSAEQQLKLLRSIDFNSDLAQQIINSRRF